MLKNTRYILTGLLCILTLQSNGQGIGADSLESKIQQLSDYVLYRNHDTTYIKSYADLLALKLVAVNKYNYFQIHDRNNDAKLTYRPEYGVNLGLGMAYKWFSVDITFDVGLRENKNLENREFLDLQTRVYSSKRFIEAYIQYYSGYELTRADGVDQNLLSENNSRGDIRTISFGLQYLFALNYDKFSLNAPFVLSEKQRKSAGSPIFGASLVMFTMNADSSVVPTSMKPYFDEKLHVVDVGLISFAVNFGYMYTFVWKKHFFLTLGLIPGLNFNFGDTKAEEREFLKWGISYKVKTMNALGYNSSRFFTGINFVGEINNVNLKNKLSTQFSNGSIKFFAGYRFNRRKKSKS